MDESEQDATNDMDMGHFGSLEPEFDDFVSEMADAGIALNDEGKGWHLKVKSRLMGQ